MIIGFIVASLYYVVIPNKLKINTLKKPSLKGRSRFQFLTTNLFSRLIIGLSITMALAACVSKPDNVFVATSVNAVANAYAWQLNGKILVKTPNDKSSANLFWLHSPEHDEMKLTSILGTSILSLVIDSNFATLNVDGKTYRDSDANQLLKRLTGWSIPVEFIPLWVTGQFGEDTRIITRDLKGRPKYLITNDLFPWEITIKSWQRIDNVQLPKLIVLQQPNLNLKIQINHWQALALTTATQS